MLDENVEHSNEVFNIIIINSSMVRIEHSRRLTKAELKNHKKNKKFEVQIVDIKFERNKHPILRDLITKRI